MSAVEALNDSLGVIENLPGYDVAMDLWAEYAEEHFQTKDPYFEKTADGEEVRRQPPDGLTAREAQLWRRINKKAWTHDRCLFGWYWMDIGLGIAPLISIIPVVGALWMYVLHGRILTLAEDLRIPAKMHAKMSAQITFDFLISLIPILGAVFSWINACSTRNAALLDTYLRRRAEDYKNQLGPFQRLDNNHHLNSSPTARVARKGRPGQGAQMEMGVL